MTPVGRRVGGEVAERPSARDELWVPIVLVVLALLLIEWTVYHRDAAIRLRRALAGRLGRDPGAAGLMGISLRRARSRSCCSCPCSG